MRALGTVALVIATACGAIAANSAGTLADWFLSGRPAVALGGSNACAAALAFLATLGPVALAHGLAGLHDVIAGEGSWTLALWRPSSAGKSSNQRSAAHARRTSPMALM